jgi:predicted PolB exonuclease-like 3'-5' exonuclease
LKPSPNLVTFNGHSLDLPVLRLECKSVFLIRTAGLQVRQYFQRYTEDALDLCDVSAAWPTNSPFNAEDRLKAREEDRQGLGPGGQV